MELGNLNTIGATADELAQYEVDDAEEDFNKAYIEAVAERFR
jgi:hypothetical protein